MTWFQFWGSLIFLVLAVAAALAVFLVLRGPAGRLMEINSRLAQARPFYVRVLLVTLMLMALGVAGGRVFTLPEGAAFMEYVWQAAGSLNGVLGYAAVIVGIYSVMLMVLLLVLGWYRDN